MSNPNLMGITIKCVIFIVMHIMLPTQINIDMGLKSCVDCQLHIKPTSLIIFKASSPAQIYRLHSTQYILAKALGSGPRSTIVLVVNMLALKKFDLYQP